jgi:hypothetical protein
MIDTQYRRLISAKKKRTGVRFFTFKAFLEADIKVVRSVNEERASHQIVAVTNSA